MSREDFRRIMDQLADADEATKARWAAEANTAEAAYASLRRGMTALDMAHTELRDAFAGGAVDAIPYLQALDDLLGDEQPDDGRPVLVLCAHDAQAGYLVDARQRADAPWQFLAGRDVTPLLHAASRVTTGRADGEAVR